MSLQHLIVKQDARGLNETSKESLQRHVQKFAKAAQKSLAKCALQEDQVRFLTTINNEAKVRRSTRSLVIGKAKVMSYEDLRDARAKRAEKDAAKEAKGNRGRKRKRATLDAKEATADEANRGRKHKGVVLEPEAPEPNAKAARTRASVVQMSGTPVVEDEIVRVPWRAPVAQMY